MTLSFVLTVWNAYITSDCIPIQVTVFFGMYLECMAIIPQFYMTIAERKVKKGMVRFPMALALYKFMYFVQSFIPFNSKDDTIEACFAFTYLTFFLLYSIVFYCVGIDVTEIEDKPPEYKLSLIEDSDHILKLNSGETEGCAQNEKI
ncbi:hypothetical protein NQ318_002773 [Aromia moschata]|uniref:Uncharacterized protein n=1 Tax=Aromia moschata TaxID=1265417 RepID=A0AAV8XTR4_9CUCU|nr:hypothetical protein NQ318_002773 [Aromia moschata]